MLNKLMFCYECGLIIPEGVKRFPSILYRLYFSKKKRQKVMVKVETEIVKCPDCESWNRCDLAVKPRVDSSRDFKEVE